MVSTSISKIATRISRSARVRIPAAFSRAINAARLFVRVPSAFLPVRTFSQLSHLPFSVPQAFELLLANRSAAVKIKKGSYSNNLVFIAGMSKSASILVHRCIAEMQSGTGGQIPNPPYMNALRPSYDWNLRPEMVHEFPNGGVIRSHAKATTNNIFVLNLLNINKYVIVVRHPADQMTAVYCNLLETVQESDQGKSRTALGNHKNWNYHPVCPINMEEFRRNLSPDLGIPFMMEQGYLHESLAWIANWLRYREENRSIIVRYEDFVTHRPETLNKICNFVLNKPSNEQVLVRCEALVTARAQRRFPVDEYIYPKGWTGEVGVSDKYFSKKAREKYQSLVDKFLDFHPQASLLNDLYPGLREIG